MANTAFQSRSDASPVTPAQVSVPILGATVAVFAAVSFLLCMLLGFVAPEWGLHKPWLQFFLGLTGFDLRSLALGIVQSVVFGGYAGALLGTIFNVISRRFG
ncbi:MFS-type transporter involved in bile tolerance (Atg22 family) [Rhizobium leguminosarum]|uniref:ABC transporter permease n=2 Tax=Rhizobium leguminosarum TaxID=384 RepID=A0ABF7QY54_RHILW|nr:hypothetical protein [Rhizobium leguminosarum]ACI59040.1 conserved hypothetical protein [Rhizobium leguminosarum bv. trifolii WSM2304]NYJ14305.1 MFS-type transporter involved in bile tolerance (Atg22 family) [Rhizobium leguminosarum]